MATVLAKPQVRRAYAIRLPEVAHKYKRAAFMGAPLLLLAAVTLSIPAKVAVVSPSPLRLRSEAVGTGFVKAKVVVGVGAKINGVVLKNYVDQGDPVRKGQLLAELQNSDVLGQVAQARNQLGAQSAALTSARANLSAAEARRQAAVTALERSKAGLRLAEITFHRAKDLYAAGVYSREAFDLAETAYDQARQDVENAQALRLAAEQQVEAARSDVEATDKSLAGSAAGVDVQRANLAYTILRSPVDGYIVTRDLEEGATVVPGLQVFTVADSSIIWVSANIDEHEMDGLRVGQPAVITLRSNPNRKLSGKVARIAQQADPVTEEVIVDVAFVPPPPDLKLEETAEVTILKSEKAAALAVPLTAVVRGPDGPTLWAVRDGRLRMQPVSVGIRDKRGLVEVLSGVASSDLVLSNPSAANVAPLPGMRVRTSWSQFGPTAR